MQKAVQWIKYWATLYFRQGYCASVGYLRVHQDRREEHVDTCKPSLEKARVSGIFLRTT